MSTGSKDDKLILEGKIIEALPNTTFRVNWKMACSPTLSVREDARARHPRAFEADAVRVDCRHMTSRVVELYTGTGHPGWA